MPNNTKTKSGPKVTIGVSELFSPAKVSAVEVAKEMSNNNVGKASIGSVSSAKKATSTTTQKATNPTVVTPASGTENDYINKVADLEKAAKQSEYENAYNKVMSQIEEARAKTKAEYQAQRNNADASNQLQQKNYFENVANRGQTNSGSTSQGELALKIAGMNNQSALQSGQAQAMADLNREATNAYSDYVNNVTQSNANIDIQRYQNLLEQYRIDQERASKEAKEALEREIATIAQYDSDYAAEITRREALNPNDPLIPYLKIARQEKLDELEKELQEKIKAEQEAEKEAREKEAEAREKEIKVLMQLKDYDALDALGYDTSLLRKESALDMANTQSLINNRNSSGGGSSNRNSSGTANDYAKNAENNGKAINDMYGDILVSYGNGTFAINPNIKRAHYLDLIIARTIDNRNLNDTEKLQFLNSLGISDDEIDRVVGYYVK